MKILLKNGTIYDGTGSAPYVGDVLIEDDRILKVGKNLAADGGGVIDVEGLAVCPGLIDAHSHNDFLYDRPDAEKYYRPFIEQGITTQITGNCSFSPFGIDPDTPYRDKIGGGLFDALHPCSFAEFKNRAKGRLFVNLVPRSVRARSVRALPGMIPRPLPRSRSRRSLHMCARRWRAALSAALLASCTSRTATPSRMKSSLYRGDRKIWRHCDDPSPRLLHCQRGLSSADQKVTSGNGA